VTPASDQDLLFQTQLVSPTSGDVLGKLISGQLAVGDTVWLDGVQQVIEKISHGKNTVSRVQAPLSIAIGISKKTSQSSAPLVRRGDWIVSRPDLAQAINRLSLEVVWLSNEDVQTGTFLRLKYLGQESRACVLEVEPSGRSDKIFYLKLSLSHPIYLWSGAPFKSCRGMILQDFEKNWTVAAGLWLPVSAH
jgi:sulfate adenylyltransferase subunit 1 (EFTu-like GTPase family)